MDNAQSRQLTIFAHANTGEDLADHTQHVIWFGPSEPLDLSIFELGHLLDPTVGIGRVAALDIHERRPQAQRQRS